MKYVSMFFLLVLMTFACHSSGKMEDNKRPKETTDREQFTRDIAHEILIGMKTGDYVVLTEDMATEGMVRGFNNEVQKYAAMQTLGQFGEYIGVGQLTEVIDQRTDNIWIYRYKGEFEGELEAEIRVVLDSEGKLAGFFVLPWRNIM